MARAADPDPPGTPAQARGPWIDRRFWIVTAGFLLYGIVFILLYPYFRLGVAPLVVVPIIVGAWYYGTRGGALFALAGGTFNLIVAIFYGGTLAGYLEGGGTWGWIISVLVGLVIGRLRDLEVRLQAELAERQRAEAALRNLNARLGGIVSERTAQLQAELETRQELIEDLEEKNAELERFNYTVSHDLRAPLVTIQGFLGYLERAVDEGRREAFQRDLARISRATIRMDELLRDLLELSRVGRVIHRLEPVPFEDLVHEANENVRGRLEERGVDLRVQPGLPAVLVDRPRLVEVLQNLLENAAKYMGDQREPRIEVGRTGGGGERMVFYVRDNGVGIAPDYHEKVFGLFNKLDPQSEGTGVGLALVRRIIEYHGGRIWLESQPGRGSTFFFELRQAVPPGQAQVEAHGR